MSWSDTLPSLSILIPTLGLAYTRLENQMLVKGYSQDVYGNPQKYVFFAGLSGTIAALFGFLFFTSYWYDFGFWQAVVLIVLASFLAIFLAFLTSMLLGMKRVLLSFPATVLMWVFVAWLSTKVTWFGFF